jgi:hypothetical protein
MPINKSQTQNSATMSTQDIVKNCDEIKDSGQDWKQAYAALHSMLESNQYRIMRAGNTLFLIKLLEQGTAQMFVFNADSPKNFLKNTKEFFKAMKAAKFHTVFGVTENLQSIKMLQNIGFKVNIENAGTDDNGQPLYKGIVHVF